MIHSQRTQSTGEPHDTKQVHIACKRAPLAPSGTPADVVARLQGALATALAWEKLQQRLRELGTELGNTDTMSSAGFSSFIKAEYERMRLTAQIAGLKKE